ncbi:MAG: hypothetical protein J6N15_04425 [Ruminiclostridium sp.]|nr:hypothetical protein [Ruminiclostridium sp.]
MPGSAVYLNGIPERLIKWEKDGSAVILVPYPAACTDDGKPGGYLNVPAEKRELFLSSDVRTGAAIPGKYNAALGMADRPHTVTYRDKNGKLLSLTMTGAEIEAIWKQNRGSC